MNYMLGHEYYLYSAGVHNSFRKTKVYHATTVNVNKKEKKV